jgi:hypothetical protein
MSSSAAPDFPYDHLGVLGFQKLQRYIPPLRAIVPQAEESEPDPSGTAVTPPGTPAPEETPVPSRK